MDRKFVEQTIAHKAGVQKRIAQFCEYFAYTASAHGRAKEELKISSAWGGFQVCQILLDRAFAHDNSKFSPEEESIFAAIVPMLDAAQKEFGYDSPKHRETRAMLGPALQHHYENNSHHPEHYPNGVNGMDLFDVTEMLCDWWAVAGDKKESICLFIEANAKRFSMDEQLVEVLLSTVHRIESKATWRGLQEKHIGICLAVLFNEWIWCELWCFSESTPKEAWFDQLKKYRFGEQVSTIFVNTLKRFNLNCM